MNTFSFTPALQHVGYCSACFLHAIKAAFMQAAQLQSLFNGIRYYVLAIPPLFKAVGSP